MRTWSLSLVMVLCAVAAQAQPAPVEPAPDPALEVIKVQGNVWMIAGAGANIAVQAGEQGVIVVDTGAAGLSERVIAAIRGISTRPIRYIINTSVAPQHVGGNAVLAALPGGSTAGAARGATVAVIAQENVQARMTRPVDGSAPFPSAAWPTDGYYAPRRGMIFNGEGIDIIHLPNAHSDGDSAVYFRGSNVLVTGDVYTTVGFPIVNRAMGGTYAGTLTALNTLLDIAIPDDLAEGGTYIVPGHGRISDEADLVEYRDMVHIIRDRLAQMAADRLTIAQVKAARPAIGWEARYSRPGWTTDMFIETVYPEFTR
jgi:glyoxylase-like metal-dependent hydrolase (beta-lactamase superfamily II)